jgi:hypothetical protein
VDGFGRALVAQVGLQIHELLYEGGLLKFVAGVEGVGREAVGARRPANTEVDAAGVQRLQHFKVLRHFQGRVVGQHHAARA